LIQDLKNFRHDYTTAIKIRNTPSATLPPLKRGITKSPYQMEIILLILVVFLTILIILGSIYTVWIGYEQWQYMHDPHKMLFLSSTNKEIDKKLDQIIAKYLLNTEDYNLVELGCGKAMILKSLAQKYQWKSVTGIEGQKSVYLQAWFNCNLKPKIINTLKLPLDKGLAAKQTGVSLVTTNKIQLLNQNIFDYKSKKPTFHYCYLGVKLMKELYDKGLFTDSIVVSLDYEIEGIEPIEIIMLETKSKIQNLLFVYKN
jgi:hypothetical protein